MGCDHPRNAWYSVHRGPSGKRLITFNRNQAFSPTVLKLPCGQCIGCRLYHAGMWAVRCMHEKRLHDVSTFVTLTYDDKHLPENGSLVREHPQLWLKRMRNALAPERFRFYGCGEYGDKSNRPHYHLILFGWDDPCKRYYGKSKNGDDLYTSEFIDKYWHFGNNIIGDVTFKSCAYVAGYVTGKITGDMADDHYAGRLPEFNMMSRGDGSDDPKWNGGIGKGWYARFGEHAYKWDSVIVGGKELTPPRYYDTKYVLDNPEHMDALKKSRRRRAMARKADNTSGRRHVKEEVLRRNLKIREI